MQRSRDDDDSAWDVEKRKKKRIQEYRGNYRSRKYHGMEIDNVIIYRADGRGTDRVNQLEKQEKKKHGRLLL